MDLQYKDIDGYAKYKQIALSIPVKNIARTLLDNESFLHNGYLRNKCILCFLNTFNKT